MSQPRTESDAWGPGEFLRLVAGELAKADLDARLTASDESHYVTVGGFDGVRCEVTPGDRYGSVACQYWPAANVTFTVVDIIGLAVSLLTGDRITDLPGPDGHVAGDALLSVAGQQLKARGFDVWLDVEINQVFYEAVAELVVTNPAGRDDPRVFIAGDGSVTWAGDYPAVNATSAAATAATVTAILTRPLACGILEKVCKEFSGCC